jgi:uncharacterized protein
MRRISGLALAAALLAAQPAVAGPDDPGADNPLGGPIIPPRPRLVEPDAPWTPPPGGPKPDLAFGAYQRGYFIVALREASKRIADDPKDAAAMTLIGEIYRDGFAVKQDFPESVNWFRLAANLGYAGAQFELGVMLLDGAPGVPRDTAAATAEFEKAGAQGYASALYNLGVLALEAAPPAKPDFEKAAGYFKRAAELGDGNAAYSFGVQLKEGKGVPLDTEAAAHWLKTAADDGIIAGQVEYAIMLFNGNGVERDEQGAARIFTQAATRHNPIAMNRLAHLYLAGRGVPKDLVQAAAWHRLAKAAGLEDTVLDKVTEGLSEDQEKQVQALVQRQLVF